MRPHLEHRSMRAVALLACMGPLQELSKPQQNPPQQRPLPPAGTVEGASAFGPWDHRAVALLASMGSCLYAQHVPAEPVAAVAGTLHTIYGGGSSLWSMLGRTDALLVMPKQAWLQQDCCRRRQLLLSDRRRAHMLLSTRLLRWGVAHPCSILNEAKA